MSLNSPAPENYSYFTYDHKLLFQPHFFKLVLVFNCIFANVVPTLTMTSIENAVTANSHVDGECRDQSADSKIIGATNKKAQTHSARMCRLRDGFRAALSDIRIGATILCKK